MERIARNDTSWNTIETHPNLTALVMTHHKTADPEDTAHELKKLLRWWVGPELEDDFKCSVSKYMLHSKIEAPQIPKTSTAHIWRAKKHTRILFKELVW
jgi:hypothetical protein